MATYVDANDSSSATDLIYEDITNGFGKGKLGEFDVIIMKYNGYINASKLCSDGDKRYSNWFQLEKSNELIDTVESSMLGSQHAIIKITYQDIPGIARDVQNSLLGTYVHSDIIVHVAMWISVNYAVKVSRIMMSYHTHKHKTELRQLTNDKKTLEDQVAEMLVNQNIIINQNVATQRTLGRMEKLLGSMHDKLANNVMRNGVHEEIIIYRMEGDDPLLYRIRAGQRRYISKYETDVRWYMTLPAISNAKRALNIMKQDGILPVNNGCTYTFNTREEKLFVRKFLRKLNNSYCADDEQIHN
jgi:hypothetical protein